MRKLRTSIFSIIILILISACSNEKPTYKLIHSENEPENTITRIIKRVLEENLDVNIELVNGVGSISNLDSLSAGTADITIVENNMPFREDIRSIFPIYEQVLHIFYRSDVEINSFKDLVYGKKVYIGTEGSSTHRFMTDMFEYFRLDKSQYEITSNIFDNDVICGFTDIINDISYIQSIEAEGYRLYSFDAIENYGKGSIAEGIGLKYPQLKPFIIPHGTYGNMTEEPILTIATDAILIVRAELYDELVYDISKTIFRDKQELNEISPLVYSTMDENFDRGKVNYPLHNGARIFLDRDEPSFLERYAELGGVIFSIILALISGIVSLSRWQTQKKKDRVDVFYKDLIEIKNSIPRLGTVGEGLQGIKNIQLAQNKAFEMLIDEKLEANESFRIYMELSKETINELKVKIKRLKLREEKMPLNS